MKKKSKGRRILEATGTTFITPLLNFRDALDTTKDGIGDFISKSWLYLKNANILRKDLYSANMEIGKFHYENGNIFDAKFRYRMAHFFGKDKTQPLLLLAEILIAEKKNKKAIIYLKKALSICKTPQERQAVTEIINNL